MASTGKEFEQDFDKSCEGLDATRLKDPIGGRSGVRNHCDFIVHLSPCIFHLELKSRKERTLYINDIPKNQIIGLVKKSTYTNSVAGILLQFSDFNEVYFVEINEIMKLQDQGVKSVHINWCREKCKQLEWKRPRTRFKYSVEQLLTELSDKYGK